jgi:hypothetical protein
MSADRLLAIQSSLENDPAACKAVEQLVVGLSERIDGLQDAEIRGKFDEIARMAIQLVHDSEVAGYEELAAVAKTLAVASNQRDNRATHLKLVDLTEVVHRVRLGHRGAA